jgi:hypothetical protein
MEGKEFVLMFLLVPLVRIPLILSMILVDGVKTEPPFRDLVNPMEDSSAGQES